MPIALTLPEIILDLVYAAMALGIGLIIFVPFFPGLAVILASVVAYVGYRSYGAMTFAGIDIPSLVIIVALSVIGMTSSWWSEKLGLRFSYMSQQVMWGAIIGSFIGIFIWGMVGFLLGLILGVFVMELRGGKKPGDAIRQGLGSLLSLLGPRGMQLMMALLVASTATAALH